MVTVLPLEDGVSGFFVAKPWQKSINKKSLSKAESFYGQSLWLRMWGWGKVGGRCVHKKEVRVPLTRVW